MKKVFLVLPMVLMFPGVLTTAAFGADLKSYQDKYAAAVKGIQLDCSTNITALNDSYAAGLMKLKESIQAAGDLEQVKAVIVEINRFAASQSLSESEVTNSLRNLQMLQLAFIKKSSELKSSEARRLLSLLERYDKALALLQSDLTKQDQLGEATHVLEERNAVKQAPDMLKARDWLSKEAPIKQDLPTSNPAIVKTAAVEIGKSGPGHVRIKTFIDGLDILKLRGDKLWFEHVADALPGRWNGQNLPTFVDKQAWVPVWAGNTSEPYEGIKPGLSSGKVALHALTQRGSVTILEQPSKENDCTLSVSINDKKDGGAGWFEFDLRWIGSGGISSPGGVATPTVTVSPAEGNRKACTIYWSCADAADIYINGKPLIDYSTSFYTRPDEANRDFSADATIAKNDVITIGARRGSSYGVLLLIVDSQTGKVIWKTDTENWKTYFPTDKVKWYLPEKAALARKIKPGIQNEPWAPQISLQSKFEDSKAKSIWYKPDAQFAYFVSTIE